MKKYNIGFIGCGKMASAIIKGLLTSGYTKSGSIIASQIDDGEIEEKSKKLGIKIVSDNNVVVKSSDIIIIAVKPNQVLNVLDEMTQYITSNKLIVSIAAGITTNFIESKLPKNSRVVRVMPNTPVLLNEGMSAIITGKNSETKDLEIVRSLFDTVGKTLVLENEAQFLALVQHFL